MQAFLEGRIRFLDIDGAVADVLARVDGAPARDLDELVEADRSARESRSSGMSIFVAILGLAFLILIHEAGHFFTAIAVGMRPRKFYIGFPPPLASVRRRGIEYGIGTIPLGGYVKIPGMHRPARAGSRLPAAARRSSRRPSSSKPLEAVKRQLAAGDYDGGRAPRSTSSRRRCAQAGQPTDVLTDVRDALAPDAYWRQRAWKKVARDLRGAGRELALRDRRLRRSSS